MADDARYSLYPSCYYRASPTYNRWVKLTAADVHCLRRGRYCHGPFRQVL